jgi:hypothetical protein
MVFVVRITLLIPGSNNDSSRPCWLFYQSQSHNSEFNKCSTTDPGFSYLTLISNLLSSINTENNNVIYQERAGDNTETKIVIYQERVGDNTETNNVIYQERAGDNTENTNVIYQERADDNTETKIVIYQERAGDNTETNNVIYQERAGDPTTTLTCPSLQDIRFISKQILLSPLLDNLLEEW